jgi:hypothetical protein
MPTPRELTSYWQSMYGDHAPDELRHVYPDRWVRFHSLPESKRYADSNAEYLTILERHNAVISELTSTGDEVLFLSTGYSPSPDPIRYYEHLSRLDPTARFWRTIAKHQLEDDEENPNYWHLFFSTWSWSPGVFDSLLRLVADDVIANIHLASTSARWIYHPYDGGADVILNTAKERDSLKQTFSHWLSQRDDGH